MKRIKALNEGNDEEEALETILMHFDAAFHTRYESLRSGAR